MKAFIDESGTFTVSTERPSLSVVGGLVLPGKNESALQKLYGRLRSKLPKHKGEVKGRLLSETEVQEVCRILRMLEALFFVEVFDSGMSSIDSVRHQIQLQSSAMTRHLTDSHHPNLVKQVHELGDYLRTLSPQLYVQAALQMQLLRSIINDASIYYSLRHPKELETYDWEIDAKSDNGITNWEDWWSKVTLPILESIGVREPFQMATFGDYTFQSKFVTKMSDYKADFYGAEKGAEGLDLGKMLSSISFESKPSYGLECVDILTNALRRSLVGNFKRDGWMPIRNLMIHKNKCYLSLTVFSSRASLSIRDLSNLPYAEVLRDFSSGGRSMLRSIDYRNAAKS